jgi:hypothetical protein
MKEVIAHYIKIANCLDDAGYTESAQEFTELAIKTAQVQTSQTNPRTLDNYKQIIESDAKKAADSMQKVIKGEMSKESFKQEILSMLSKQNTYKASSKISSADEAHLLNKFLNKNDQTNRQQTTIPVFRSVQEAENYYNQKHTFKTPQEAQKFQADKMRFLKSTDK